MRMLLLLSLIFVSLSCSDSSSLVSGDGSRTGYYDTTWPNDHTDLWRTHAVKGAGLASHTTSDDLEATVYTLGSYPAWGYSREADQIYVIGGSPFLLDLFTDNIVLQTTGSRLSLETLLEELRNANAAVPYLAALNPSSVDDIDFLFLEEGSTVNYTGGVLVHENGYVYAVARSVLYKIDADGFEILKAQALPVLINDDESVNLFTAYNGLQVISNGYLLLKGVDISSSVAAPGKLVLVDPENLDIKVDYDTTLLSSARMTLAEENGVQYLYHINTTDLIRFEVSADSIVLDETWSGTYRSSDSASTQGSSPLYMKGVDTVVFSDNTSPFGVGTPMAVYSQSTVTATPNITGFNAYDTSAIGANFFMVAADPFSSNMFVVEDQNNGLVSGWKVVAENTIERVWTTGLYSVSAGVAIAVDQQHLYVDDRRCQSDDACEIYLVVLDLLTGEHIAEIKVGGSLPSIGQMFIAGDAVYYIASEAGSSEGFVTKVTNRGSPSP